jgi:hypothetical protein
LHALARPGQNILRRSDRLRCLSRGLGEGRLQGADGTVERQPLLLKHLRRGTAPVANNRRQNNGTIDISPAPTARGRSSGFENAAQSG